MITIDEIKAFCKKHKIKEPWFNLNDPTDTRAIILMSEMDYFRKFYKKRPNNLWIYLETDDEKLDEEYTKFYDPKLNHYYVSDTPDSYEDYTFKAPCYMKFFIPFSSYKENKIIDIFNHIISTKSTSLGGVDVYSIAYAPFGTIDELEYLYNKSINNMEDNLAYLSDPNFIQAINKYKENTEHIKELSKANEDLKNKTCTILFKKAVISNEFKEEK